MVVLTVSLFSHYGSWLYIEGLRIRVTISWFNGRNTKEKVHKGKSPVSVEITLPKNQRWLYAL